MEDAWDGVPAGGLLPDGSCKEPEHVRETFYSILSWSSRLNKLLSRGGNEEASLWGHQRRDLSLFHTE